MKLNRQNKAWMLLSEEEQLALKLNLGLKKSTWKAGEIMRKSHYKLIEIKDRGRTFLKIFSNHFNEYHKLIPDGVTISPDLRTYLEATIIRRKRISQAIGEIDNPLYHHISTREESIALEVTKWKSSVRIPERELYNLIMDFDRWNNFRIMPKSIQEPSAFKRRDKNRLKKHLKIGTSIPAISHKVIKTRFEHKTNRKANVGYLSLITAEPQRVEIIKVKTGADNLALLSKASLYIFPSHDIAQEYLSITLEYIRKDAKHCIEGLKFWPRYRAIIKSALNYETIQNIIPSRRYLEFINPDKKLL